jgi:hypothetical protein
VDPKVKEARLEVAEPWVDRPQPIANPETQAGFADDEELKSRMAKREAYILRMRAGQIERRDYRDPAAGVGGPAREAVRIRGSDSLPTAGVGSLERGAEGAGHVMATQMLPDMDGGHRDGLHYSFSSSGGSHTAIGTGQPPFAESRPTAVSAVRGQMKDIENDNHLRSRLDFDHAFDPRFLDPKRFAEKTAVARARGADQPDIDDAVAAEINQLECGPDSSDEALDGARRKAKRTVADDPRSLAHEYRLMTVPVDRREARSNGEAPTLGRDAKLSEDDSRVVSFVPPDGGPAVPTVQAQNCATQLMHHMAAMGVLTVDDFLMLGADRAGRFLPKHDLTPQQLYEHLRWREHEHLERLKRQEPPTVEPVIRTAAA